MGQRTVYVQLLDEGIPTYRPTIAEEIQAGVFRLQPTPDYDPEDEVWEFTPGSVVLCQERVLHGPAGETLTELVAVSEYDRSSVW